MPRKQVVVILEEPAADAAAALEFSVRDRVDRSGIDSVLQGFGATARRLFPQPPPQDRSFLASSAPGDDPAADILREQQRYLVVDVADDQAEALAGALRAHGGVEGAYVQPAPENPLAPRLAMAPGAPPATASQVPDLSRGQGYLEPSPVGIDARFAATLPGGQGETLRVIDIEGSWQFAHVDLLQNSGGLLAGTLDPDIRSRNHGTAVLGEIGGDDDGAGIRGIAPRALLAAVSHSNSDPAPAIQLAAQRLGPGDVLLLEMHIPGPRFNYDYREDQRGFIPVEWWPGSLLAIRYALAKGVVVIEAAGNGAENLDDPLYDRAPQGFPANWSNPFRTPDNVPAAIMVGAGAPPTLHFGPDRSRLDFSNYGNRVDCQGWGRDVQTTGYGDLLRSRIDPSDENYWYTATFSGTSSASPIVAGAAACLVGVARARGRALTPGQIRRAFRNTGAPQQPSEPGGPLQRIGPRPDLRQLLRETFTLV